MKKVGFAVVLLLCMLMCAPVWAVDVHWEGAKIGEAKVVDGATYLPMRVLFERCGATVDYVQAEKKIGAVRPDGERLEMRLGDNKAVVNNDGVVTSFWLSAVPYVEGGRVYVPIRFVGKMLLCDVEWREGAVWIEPDFGCDWADENDEVYWLRYSDGVCFAFNRQRQESRELVRFDLAKYDLVGGMDYALNGLLVSRGDYGYIVEVCIFNRNISPSSGNLSYIYAWTNGANVLFGEHKPLVQDGRIYMTGDGKVYAAEYARGGEVRSVELDNAEQYMVKWVQGDRLLLQRGAEFKLVDMRTATVRDLQADIFNEENTLRLQTIAEVSGDEVESYWLLLNAKWCVDKHPQVKFIEGKSDSLRFRLTAAYTWDENRNYRYFDIEVTI